MHTLLYLPTLLKSKIDTTYCDKPIIRGQNTVFYQVMGISKTLPSLDFYKANYLQRLPPSSIQGS